MHTDLVQHDPAFERALVVALAKTDRSLTRMGAAVTGGVRDDLMRAEATLGLALDIVRDAIDELEPDGPETLDAQLAALGGALDGVRDALAALSGWTPAAEDAR